VLAEFPCSAQTLCPTLGQNDPLPGSSAPREDTLTRTAQCCCGSLRLVAPGDPTLVAACHCTECQRRTGAAFGVAAYFEKSQVKPEGTYKIYTRDGQEGRKVRIHFCPEYGTSVYWDADFLPTHIGVAVGTFLDPSFPAPTRSVWEQSRYPWVNFNHDLEHFHQTSLSRN
jgi:hypothetical protein